MKLKGISWIEANFEKAIVGVMLVVFLAVLVLQFVLQSRVDVGGQKLALRQAFQPALREAEALSARMSDADPELPAIDPESDPAAELLAMFEGSSSSPAPIAPFGRGVSLAALEGQVQVAGNVFAAFEPPAPARPLAASYRATLDPYAIDELREELSSLLPPEQPYDMPWVSVQSSVDAAALRAAFEADPDGPAGETQALPPDWWAEKQSVLAVEFERQELLRDGSWSSPEPVGLLPGDTAAVDLAAAPANWRELDILAVEAGRQEPALLRASFYPILEGETWTPPSEITLPEDVGERESEIRVLERRLKAVRGDLESRRAAVAGGSSGSRPTREGEPGGGGGHGGGGGETDRPAQPEQGPSSALQARIAQLEAQEAELLGLLGALGWTEEGASSAREREQAFDPERYAGEQKSSAGLIPLWRHDVAVGNGSTLRYRVRVVMANPLFGRQASLAEGIRSLGEAPFVRSAWSEWSDPVDVGWSEYFFIEDAAAGANLGGVVRGPTAQAELYRFYYGHWRRGTVSLQPGDRFVAEVDLPEGLQIWDTARPATEQAWVPGEAAQQPTGISLIEDSLVVEADAWLLDVIPSAFVNAGGLSGRAQGVLNALIRGPDGRVSLRIPSEERLSPSYSPIKVSSNDGMTQIPRVPGQARRSDSGRDADRGGNRPDREWPGSGHGGGGETDSEDTGGHGGGGGG